MGALSDFLAGAFGNYGQQRAQMAADRREEQKYQQRLNYAAAADAIRRRTQNQDRATELNLQGPQVGLDDAGRPSLMRAVADVDPETGALTARRERVGEAPVTPAGRPFTVYDGQSRRTVQRYSDGSERDLGDPSPVRQSNRDSGGSDRRRFTTVTNPDGSKTQYDEQTGEPVRTLPAAPGKRETQADAKAKLETLNAVAEADSVTAVKNVLRANGINPDSREVMNLPLGSDGDYLTSLKQYATEKLSGKSQGKKADDSQGEVSSKPPVEGAKKAQDGNWYVQRNGKWYRVESD